MIAARLSPGALCLLDHLVSGRQQRFRDGKAEGFGGLEVDGHLKFCRKLHRQLGGLRACLLYTSDAADE